jgi:hypothetical protein
MYAFTSIYCATTIKAAMRATRGTAEDMVVHDARAASAIHLSRRHCQQAHLMQELCAQRLDDLTAEI